MPQQLSGPIFIVPKLIKGEYDPCERKTKDFCRHRGLIWAEFLLNRVPTSLLRCSLAVNHHPVLETHLSGAFESQCDFHLHTLLLKASQSISSQWAAIAGKKGESHFYFNFLWLSPPTLHSLCASFWDSKEAGHLPVWIVLPYQNLQCPFLHISDLPRRRLYPL